LHSFDSGDPAKLLETAQWAFGQCPARRYALVLWSHGTAYWNQRDFAKITQQVRGDSADAQPTDRAAAETSLALFRTTLEDILREQSPDERAILFDDGTQHSLDTLQLDKVTQDIQQFIGQPLDLLGMDACLMGNIEVAYQLRKTVHHLVASEELVPASSWPYDQILGKLAAHPEMSAAELAKHIVQDYAAFYAASPPQAGDVTHIALDLSQIDPFVCAMKGLVEVLRPALDTYMPVLWKAQVETYATETQKARRDPSKFKYHLWDIASLTETLAQNSTDAAIRQAATQVYTLARSNPAILAEIHQGAWFDKIGGLSVYMAPTHQPELPLSKTYPRLAFPKATGWDKLLQDYKARM